MAAAAGVCEVCGQNEFTLEDGFYYCNECGTKLQTQREVVNELEDSTVVGVSSKIEEGDVLNEQITSWEQLNYILLGLTDRLIELGAPVELKPTVLQIWCSFLRITEVAFFNKRQRVRPRLGLFNFRNDIEILFNRVVPRSSSRTKKSDSINTSTTRGKKKLNQQLLEEEHDAVILSQNSDLESSLSNVSSSLLSPGYTKKALKFQFNSRVRKTLLDSNIDEEHIEWHEQEAPFDAPCHSFTALLPKKRIKRASKVNWSRVCRKTVLIGILTLALNQVKSQIQHGDLCRWIDEGHLPLKDPKQLLPDWMDPTNYSEVLVYLHSINEDKAMTTVSLLSRELGVIAVEPDMLALCRRYLGELALPFDLEPYIAKLIGLGVNIKPSLLVPYPAYEQHAMKYILLVMKLLFGLDGVIEAKLDALSGKINQRLSGVRSGHTKLFVWHEWQQYVAMRHTILEQLHYPTSKQRAKMNTNVSVDSDLFLDFQKSTLVPDDDNTTGYRGALLRVNHGPYHERQFRNIHSLVTTITSKKINETDDTTRKHVNFAHSLQPQRSYLAEVLEDQEMKASVAYIPDYMWTDHSKRSVVPFVNPMPLKMYLLQHHNVRLITKSIEPPISHIRMTNVPNYSANIKQYLKKKEFVKVQELNSSESSDMDQSDHERNILDYINARSNEKLFSHEELFQKVVCRNALEKIESELQDSINDCANDLNDETINPFKNNPSIREKLAGEEQCSEKMVIGLSNFHYWVRGLPSFITGRKFMELGYNVGLPKSFQFLLLEAAHVARCHPYELYCKLDELEKHMFKQHQRIK